MHRPRQSKHNTLFHRTNLLWLSEEFAIHTTVTAISRGCATCVA